VWQTNFWTSAKTIDVHLGWVRRKLGDDTRRPTLITTVRGRGLRFELSPPIYADLAPAGDVPEAAKAAS
jgi:DNA-binding response OmpR family regulator